MSVTGLGRIATAEKMSVNQLQEALENKTLPAYIAVPLIEEKMNMNSRMQAMAAMQQVQQEPPIAEQIMQRAVAESGINMLPSNLPVVRGAGGGIVAFADGGDAEDDDDDDEDETSYGASRIDKENEALLMRLLASRKTASPMGPEAFGSGLTIPQISTAPQVSAAPQISTALQARSDMGINALPAGNVPAVSLTSAKEERSIGLRAPSGHKYEDKIVNKAEQMGIDPQFALYIAGKETGGLRNPETAKSRAGAMGVMQLMPGTAKDMGVKDPFDPEQNIEGGLRYAKLMMDKYKDPKLAAIAYNWGPGNTDKWLRAGADPDKLPRETRNYVASLKEGGAIRFQNEGLVQLADFFSSPSLNLTNQPTAEEILAQMEQERREKGPKFGELPPVPGAEPKGLPITDPRIQKKLRETAEGMSPEAREEYLRNLKARAEGTPFGTPAPAKVTTDPGLAAAAKALESGEGAKTPNFADKFEALLASREKNIAAQRQQDKYMALLAAGLGMMGGRSRYAAENIGQGALQGVASLQAANRQRAAEENALLSGRLGQYRVGQTEALRTQLAGEAQQTRLTQQLSAAKTRMMNEIIKAKKMDPLASMQDPNIVASVAAQADAMLAKDPGYQAIYKKIYGMDFTPEPMARAPVDYTKMFPGHKPPPAR